MVFIKNVKYFRTLQRHFVISQRCLHQDVRVRFAPSPTGHLHLGGLRTALYNYLFAKGQQGKFILRIEDTDQTRLVPGATESLIEDLLWAGIEIDEGPGNFGGSYGPYVQSERNAIYIKHIRQLLDNGTAYRCFCTERRLELLRKEALRTRQVPRYDNKCRALKPQEIAELLERKTAFCIRFKLTEHKEPFNDLIYGKVQHNVSQTEGDPVVMKSDEYPTYHFANVVDDHLMRVTHVLRGVEWQISTTKHLLLYNAFGWQPPLYGHLPLLINADGTKLSKRQGDIGIKHFRNKGYFPNALVNYVMSAGGGFVREKSQNQVIYSLNDLASQFDIEKVNSSPSRLNPEILDDFNQKEIVTLLTTESTRNELVKSVQTLVKEAYPSESNLDLDEKHILNILQWSTTRLTFLKDLTSTKLSFLWVKPVNIDLMDIPAEKMLKLMAKLNTLEFSKNHINQALKEFANEEKVKFSLFMKILRSALSGLKEGPAVAEMMEILGKDVVLERLKSSLKSNDFKNSQKLLSKAE